MSEAPLNREEQIAFIKNGPARRAAAIERWSHNWSHKAIPERIWVKLNGIPKFYESPCDDMPLLKCYIRADIHEARIKELEDVVKKLWRRHAPFREETQGQQYK